MCWIMMIQVWKCRSNELLGTGGTVIPEPADQQCGIFEAALRHGVSNKTWRTLLCEGSLEDTGPSKRHKSSINQESSWLKLDAVQVPSCDRSESTASWHNCVANMSAESSPSADQQMRSILATVKNLVSTTPDGEFTFESRLKMSTTERISSKKKKMQAQNTTEHESAVNLDHPAMVKAERANIQQKCSTHFGGNMTSILDI
ncbi:hypothetical protein T4B_8430 [Trichinella pseudospiralis]|uniref:Uncharacterized protein n=1 Tax=Trichinella pseudospiralis TaxID=6337 RepID=A0A0V1IDQ8_TRIPS|nr:hypothetical protein T4B_8430 [Trichinella pseudospiralis]